MIELGYAYLPIDRRIALATGAALPTTVRGTALEADLSGFTSLTEQLAAQYGEQRGAEELARRLNVMYEGLLGEVHRYGGTVLGFSGDAFTTWFDGDDGLRAVTCAQAMQAAMDAVPPARVKVAVASGTTRRFLVGDPAVQLLEGLAGRVVDELAVAGHLAEPGEIVLAASTRDSLGARVRTTPSGVLAGTRAHAEPTPWALPDEDPDDLSPVRPWLLPVVYERLRDGGGEFLAELRPAAALFLRFGGLEFEQDPDALERLDVFVRAVQGVLRELDGTLVQLTIGDKGAYLYAAFGAPVAHEDDRVRALLAADRLRALGGERGLVGAVSIGVAAGRLRAGAYGSSQRRTYGVLGDTVNLAARLMQAAGPDEVIVAQELRAAGGARFEWGEHARLTVKGKAAPVAVALMLGVRAAQHPLARSVAGSGRRSAPLVGRSGELDGLEDHLRELAQGSGRVVAVTGEAGLGKTRLVAEFIARSVRSGVRIVTAECPSYARTSSYAVWRPIWHRLLAGGRDLLQAADVADRLREVNPGFGPRAPLLAPLLGLDIPDTELTAGMDGKVRKTALEATLAEWARARLQAPTVLVLEDCHWIDPLSEELLEVIARATRDRPVLVLLTHRPRGADEGGALAVTRQPHYRELALGPLSDDELAQLIELRLRSTPVAGPLAARLRELAHRAEGNPFYLQELLDWVLELGPDAIAAGGPEEMPSSLQRLVLSRVDRLPERPRGTLRVASAIGRLFETALIAPVHPDAGTPDDVERQLSALQRADFVLPDDPPVTYSFVHAVTQEVAYSTLTGEARARLHGRIGRVLEQRPDTARSLDLLAFHFARSDDATRRRRYVRQAADAAAARYDLASAIAAYRNVLPLLDGAERHDALLALGRTLALAGDVAAAEQSYSTALAEARERGDLAGQGWAEVESGEVRRKQGRFDEAAHRFEQARAWLGEAGDTAGVAEALHDEGTLAAQRADLPLARERYEASLDLRRRLGDRRGTARALNGLGIVAEYDGDLARATQLYTSALDILVELGDVWATAALTNNIGMALLLQEQPAAARHHFERAVALQREIGDPAMLANFLSNLGDAARELDDLDAADAPYDEALDLADSVDEVWLIAYLLEDVAMLAAARGRPADALVLGAAAAALRAEIGTPLPAQSKQRLDARLEVARSALTPAAAERAERDGAGLARPQAVATARGLLAPRASQASR